MNIIIIHGGLPGARTAQFTPAFGGEVEIHPNEGETEADCVQRVRPLAEAAGAAFLVVGSSPRHFPDVDNANAE